MVCMLQINTWNRNILQIKVMLGTYMHIIWLSLYSYYLYDYQ